MQILFAILKQALDRSNLNYEFQITCNSTAVQAYN